jgi:teichoic acid transport system permease protein
MPIGTPLSTLQYLRATWQRRDFILTVPLGHLRAQNQNTILGNAWHLLNPLLLAGVLYVVFGILFDAGREIDNYPAFLIIGIFVFTFTQRVVMSGARAITSNTGLLRTINFPRICLPLASSIGEFYAQLVTIAAMITVVLLTGVLPSVSWLGLLPLLALQAAFSAGLAMIAARLTFSYRDVENLLPFVFRLWMYLSGVFFSVDYVIRRATEAGQPWLVDVFEANPLYTFINLTRSVLLGTDISMSAWLGASVWATASLLIGFTFFRAAESSYGQP